MVLGDGPAENEQVVCIITRIGSSPIGRINKSETGSLCCLSSEQTTKPSEELEY